MEPLTYALVQSTPKLWDWWRNLPADQIAHPIGLQMPDEMPLSSESSNTETARVTRWLHAWREILEILGMKNDVPNQRRVRNLNAQYDGPIILPKRGGQPKVDPGRLLGWWNQLEQRFLELNQRTEDLKATTEEQHPYGLGEIVLPEIKGHVEKSRKKTE